MTGTTDPASFFTRGQRMRVRVYQDVDGVLNAHMPDSNWHSRTANGHAKAEGTEYKLRWSPKMVETLDTLDAYRVWATTWCDDAETSVRPLLGLAPAAYVLHPLSGMLSFPSIDWKLAAIVHDQMENPGPFIWFDDETGFRERAIAEALGGIAPEVDSRRGLTVGNLEIAESYITRVKA